MFQIYIVENWIMVFEIVKNSYASNVISVSFAPLISFCNECLIRNSYWDIENMGGASFKGGKSLSYAQMKLQSSFEHFDFNAVCI